MTPLTERYAKQIRGELSCFDRVIITGTLPGVCYAEGMEKHLRSRGIRLFEYKDLVAPMRDELHANAKHIARENGLKIEFIRRSKDFSKEKRIQQILRKRGDHPGLVHIFSAMERCASFYPQYDKKTGETHLKYDDARCSHYYFYFLDPELGLCHLRVPTWAPFRLQFYFNAHNWLANELRRQGITCQLLDNCFVDVGDFDRAQELADGFRVEALHRRLNDWAARFCPVSQQFGVSYQWSLSQVEYATDIIFRRQADLRLLYETLTRTAIHAVKPDRLATFLGRKLHGNYQDEAGNDFHTRLEGTCVKHHLGPVAIKMYDKHALVLRIETTVNDVSFFKHYRKVEHRDGTSEMKYAPAKKTIYSLSPLRELMVAANRRYLEFLATLEDTSAGLRHVEKISEPVRRQGRNYRGFNLFDAADLKLLRALARGEFHISGFTNRRLRQVLPQFSSSQMSRLLKRLRLHGLIKKVGRTYKYYLTRLGRTAVLTALKLRELVVIPELAQFAPATG